MEESINELDKVYKAIKTSYPKELQIRFTTCDYSIPTDKLYTNLSVVSVEKQRKSLDLLEKNSDAEEYSSHLDLHNSLYGVEKDTFEISDLLKKNIHITENRYLILGNAGMGKTTLSQYLCFCANKNKTIDYKYVFRISLRILTDKYFQSEKIKYELFHVLKKEYLKKEYLKKDYKVNILKFQECLQKEKNNVLLLLDGYDEIYSDLSDHLKSFLQSLFEFPNVILTSRPYNIFSLKDEIVFDYQKSYEITGFTKNDVKSYVEKFFKRIDSKKLARTEKEIEKNISDLNKFIEKNPNVASMCKIPINLELFCSVWEEQPIKSETGTMNRLYFQIIVSFCRRRNYKIKELKNKKILERQILGDYKKIIGFLDFFAYQTLVEKKFFLKLDKTFSYINKMILPSALKKEKNFLEDVVVIQESFGFIRPNNYKGKYDQASDYYFSHLTFRDYFAARYICACLRKKLSSESEDYEFQHEWMPQKNDSNNQNDSIEDFIKKNKFNDKFEIIWWFVAGILTHDDDKKTWTHFINLLITTPKDLLKIKTVTLLIRCMDESQEYLKTLAWEENIFLRNIAFSFKFWILSALQNEKAYSILYEKYINNVNIIKIKKPIDLNLKSSLNLSFILDRLGMSQWLCKQNFIQESVIDFIMMSDKVYPNVKSYNFLIKNKIFSEKINNKIELYLDSILIEEYLKNKLENLSFGKIILDKSFFIILYFFISMDESNIENFLANYDSKNNAAIIRCISILLTILPIQFNEKKFYFKIGLMSYRRNVETILLKTHLVLNNVLNFLFDRVKKIEEKSLEMILVKFIGTAIFISNKPEPPLLYLKNLIEEKYKKNEFNFILELSCFMNRFSLIFQKIRKLYTEFSDKAPDFRNMYLGSFVFNPIEEVRFGHKFIESKTCSTLESSKILLLFKNQFSILDKKINFLEFYNFSVVLFLKSAKNGALLDFAEIIKDKKLVCSLIIQNDIEGLKIHILSDILNKICNHKNEVFRLTKLIFKMENVDISNKQIKLIKKLIVNKKINFSERVYLLIAIFKINKGYCKEKILESFDFYDLFKLKDECAFKERDHSSLIFMPNSKEEFISDARVSSSLIFTSISDDQFISPEIVRGSRNFLTQEDFSESHDGYMVIRSLYEALKVKNFNYDELKIILESDSFCDYNDEDNKIPNRKILELSFDSLKKFNLRSERKKSTSLIEKSFKIENLSSVMVCEWLNKNQSIYFDADIFYCYSDNKLIHVKVTTKDKVFILSLLRESFLKILGDIPPDLRSLVYSKNFLSLHEIKYHSFKNVKDVEQLTSLLKDNLHLESIDISKNFFSQGGELLYLIKICNVLKGFKGLINLKLSDNGFRNNCVDSIVDLVKNLKNFSVLDISNNFIDGEGLKDLLSKLNNQKLLPKYINVSGCFIDLSSKDLSIIQENYGIDTELNIDISNNFLKKHKKKNEKKDFLMESLMSQSFFVNKKIEMDTSSILCRLNFTDEKIAINSEKWLVCLMTMKNKNFFDEHALIFIEGIHHNSGQRFNFIAELFYFSQDKNAYIKCKRVTPQYLGDRLSIYDLKFYSVESRVKIKKVIKFCELQESTREIISYFSLGSVSLGYHNCVTWAVEALRKHDIAKDIEINSIIQRPSDIGKKGFCSCTIF